MNKLISITIMIFTIFNLSACNNITSTEQESIPTNSNEEIVDGNSLIKFATTDTFELFVNPEKLIIGYDPIYIIY